jgi:hypothetical protein
MSDPKESKVQFRPGPLDPALAERADAGVSIGQVARRDLDRYYQLLTLALHQVELTPGEASLIVDALNGTFIDLTAAQMLHAEIADSLGDGLAEKWEVDGPALVAKARGWTLLQRMAVCDAVERFWNNAYHVEDLQDRLIRVGLVRIQA